MHFLGVGVENSLLNIIHALRARSSGSTNFTVLYAPVLTGAPIFHHSIRSTSFAMLYARELAGAPISPFYMPVL